MKLTKSKLKQIIQEEIKIINENIGERGRSIEEVLKEKIAAFRDILDGMFPNEMIKADDFQRLDATVESLKDIGDHNQSIKEDLEEIINDFKYILDKYILDGVFEDEIIEAYDLQSLNATLRSLITILGDIYQGEYDPAKAI